MVAWENSWSILNENQRSRGEMLSDDLVPSVGQRALIEFNALVGDSTKLE